MQSIQIAPSAPFCTIEELNRQTGLSIGTIRRRIKSGDIPTLPNEEGSRKVLINLVKLNMQLAEQS